jgi:hypothetical protein
MDDGSRLKGREPGFLLKDQTMRQDRSQDRPSGLGTCRLSPGKKKSTPEPSEQIENGSSVIPVFDLPGSAPPFSRGNTRHKSSRGRSRQFGKRL